MSDSLDPMDLSHQAPLPMGFPRQEHWSGLLFPSPGDLSDPGIELTSLMSPALAAGFFLPLVPLLISENTKQATVHSPGKDPRQNSTTLAPGSQTFSHMT